MELHSPDLSNESDWQSAKGFEARVVDNMTVASDLWVNLWVKVYDIDQAKNRKFFSGTAQKLTHSPWFDQNAVWNHFTFDWSSISSFPTNYKIKEIHVSIWGLLSGLFDGGVGVDDVLPIQSGGTTESIIVVKPNGGEKWQVGSQHNITWSSQNLSNPVKIEYSIDNGSNYTTIVASTSNDGSHSWTIPNKPSTNCLVRVSDATDGNPSDVSNAVFTISSSGNTSTGKNIEVDVGNGVKVTFDDVTSPGETTLDVKTSGPPPPSGFKIMPSGLPVYFDIKTTAGFTGNITICIPYNDVGMTATEEAKLRLHVYENPPGAWKDITKLPVDVNANIICGTVTHLTLFAMMTGPSHFTFTSPTQESYSIVVDNATLDGSQLSDRKSTRLNSSHTDISRMPSSA